MADKSKPTSGAQDTGNPVLDSVVNIVTAFGGLPINTIPKLHEMILEMAAKEPGGLRHYKDTMPAK